MNKQLIQDQIFDSAVKIFFEERVNWNGATAVYFEGKFIGQYSEIYRKSIEQFSGNKDQIFDTELCQKYMRTKTDKPLKTENSTAGGQYYFKVSESL